MTESPAQIANDLSAWARNFDRADAEVARVFRESARVIRAIEVGERVDGRTWRGLETRQLNFLGNKGRLGETAYQSLARGRNTMLRLMRELAK